MTTVHERAALQFLSDILEDPEEASEFARFRSALREMPADVVPMVDDFGQLFRHGHPGTWPLEQQVALFSFARGMEAGRYGRLQINIGRTPSADAKRGANAAALSALPGPFVAEVDLAQNGADADGHFAWTAPINVNMYIEGDTPVACEMSPRSIPLEIGSTAPSRTLLHVARDLGVARWAYGSEHLLLFLNLDPWQGIGL